MTIETEILERLKSLEGQIEKLAETMGHATREWFNTEQAAKYLSTSPNAIQKWVTQGLLVPDMPGGLGRARGHRFRRNTLDSFATTR